MFNPPVESEKRSRFRGVYKVGRKWKAQIQCKGLQYYLGVFDSEEEAARAYDSKVREDRPGLGTTNYDFEGKEAVFSQIRGNNMMLNFSSPLSSPMQEMVPRMDMNQLGSLMTSSAGADMNDNNPAAQPISSIDNHVRTCWDVAESRIGELNAETEQLRLIHHHLFITNRKLEETAKVYLESLRSADSAFLNDSELSRERIVLILRQVSEMTDPNGIRLKTYLTSLGDDYLVLSMEKMRLEGLLSNILSKSTVSSSCCPPIDESLNQTMDEYPQGLKQDEDDVDHSLIKKGKRVRKKKRTESFDEDDYD